MVKPKKTTPIKFFIQKLDFLKMYINDLIDGKIDKTCSFDEYFIFINSMFVDKGTKVYK